VVGDSKTVIGKMVSKTIVVDNILASVLKRAKKEVINFTSIKFFQLLQENNQIADEFTNQATLLKEGIIIINGNKHDLSIP
jgi:myo-inositol-1-phosphate synthase